jgi:hypothetical protein
VLVQLRQLRLTAQQLLGLVDGDHLPGNRPCGTYTGRSRPQRSPEGSGLFRGCLVYSSVG